jgi:hypothetical protein
MNTQRRESKGAYYCHILNDNEVGLAALDKWVIPLEKYNK